MNELTFFIPYAMLLVSMVAAFAVVSVATLKILRSSHSRRTAIILAFGVTIMALVGTAPIIFVPLQGKEFTKALLPSGSALMLLPFLTLAVGRLLCELLVAGSGAVAERGPQPGATAEEAARISGDTILNSRPKSLRCLGLHFRFLQPCCTSAAWFAKSLIAESAHIWSKPVLNSLIVWYLLATTA